MELLRTRICEWEPIGIDALALAPSATSGAPAAEPRLAIGRASGALELWDTTTWHMHSTSMGCDKRSFRGIVWAPASDTDDDARGVRLFTTGLSGEITEWDLSTLDVRATVSSGGGAVWGFCALRQRLLAACEDGSVRVFSSEGGYDEIFHMRRIVVGQTRLLSIATFGTDFFFVGGSDSRITKWSLTTATCEARMQVEKAGKDQETLIWTLACLGDHGIASGDSLGVVTVWDPIMCVVLHRFVQHQADVLSLASSMDGNTLISAGIDAVISTFCRQPSNEQQWVFRNSDSGHTRDVRVVALDLADTGRRQILSGGISGALLVHKLSLTAGTKRTKPMQCSGFSPCFQRASLAEDSRLVMCQRTNKLGMYYLQPPKQAKEAGTEKAAAWAGAAEVLSGGLPDSQMLTRIALSRAAEGHHLASSAITRDGSHFAASDSAGTRLFNLNISELEVRRERQFPASLLGVVSRALLFCSDSVLVMSAWESHRLHLVDVQKLTITASFADHSAPVTLLASAGEWLASADNSGVVHLFNLDSLRHQARVPGGSATEFPTAIGFDIGGKCLLIALSSHKMLVYDIEAGALRAGLPAVVAVPEDVLPRQERICSITALPGCSERVILASHNVMLALDLKQLALTANDMPQPVRGASTDVEFPARKSRGAKRRRRVATGSSGVTLHISDPADIEPCVWRTYPKMAMKHIFGIWALDRTHWGKPIHDSSFLQGLAPSEEDNGAQGSKKRIRMDIEAMVLTVEVAPETIERSLPQAFEKKKFQSTQ